MFFGGYNVEERWGFSWVGYKKFFLGYKVFFWDTKFLGIQKVFG